MTIKLLAVDMDGTLLKSRNEMTPKVEKAIQRAIQKGIVV
ncbi:MAG TPA: sugar-phosphatase, partial [Eubacteriaceae bacterium]|nr:sugar-phosphatase [Eubacteriaceae bacterium]